MCVCVCVSMNTCVAQHYTVLGLSHSSSYTCKSLRHVSSNCMHGLFKDCMLVQSGYAAITSSLNCCSNFSSIHHLFGDSSFSVQTLETEAGRREWANGYLICLATINNNAIRCNENIRVAKFTQRRLYSHNILACS